MSIEFSSTFLANSIGSTPPKKEFLFSGFTSDTREIKPDFLFIALSGEARDGHDFIEQAIEKGATGILHRKNFPLASATATSFAVNDTLIAYRLFAQAWRKQFSIPILVVAGSAGKTTTKELLTAILRGKWKNVHQTQSSQNGFTGIPATLLGLRKYHEAAVIEVGIDAPNTMEDHLEIVSPTGGLLTSIGEEHLEKLIDIETVAKEEGKLFSYLEKHQGKTAINCDDPLILKAAEKITTEKLFYGLKNLVKKTPFLLGEVDEKTQTLLINSKNNFSLPLPLEGKHNASNLLGAVATALMAGLTTEEIAAGLKTFVPPSGRSEVHIWRNNIRIYCDTYNANPLSVKMALEMFMQNAKNAAQSFVCLGDMLELGAKEEELHRALAQDLLKYKPSHVLLFGSRMKFLEDELKKQGFSGYIKHFDSTEMLAHALVKDAPSHSSILLKGSRGMRMERIWDLLQKS